MKKLLRNLLFLAIVLVCFQTVCFAKVGDVIGTAQHTSIVAYINNYAIPSYAVNGQSCIVAEDLANYGFNVRWDGEAMALYITRRTAYGMLKGINFEKTGKSGTKFADILETEIKVFANDKQLTSYAISGYTMIPMEELTMFGNIQWVPDEAALKMQVSGLPVREAKQPVKPYITADDEFYPGTTVPNYTYATGVPLKDVYISPKEEYSSIVYVYEDTHSGEYAEFIDYIGYLWDNGWEDYETTFNNGKRTYYLLKNYKLISVVCNYSNNEIFIVVSY